MRIIKLIPLAIKNPIKNVISFCKRKLKKLFRYFFKPASPVSYTFVILCVKKSVYIDLAIQNINSLHYFNPTHIFILNCDQICFEEFEKKKYKLDYLNQVSVEAVFSNDPEFPWQLYKIESIIWASQKNYILTDADGIWYRDLQIDFSKITLEVFSRNFKDNENESKIMKYCFGNTEWENFQHYVTGFVSIPSRFMNQEIAQDIRHYTTELLNCSFNFFENPKDKDVWRRISEQIAVNIALQKRYSKETFATLKEHDGPWDKSILQSLYYGCSNNVVT